MTETTNRAHIGEENKSEACVGLLFGIECLDIWLEEVGEE